MITLVILFVLFVFAFFVNCKEAVELDDRASRAEQVARTLLRIISAPVAIDGEPVSMGASIGISVYPTHAKEIDGLLGRADAAMSAARQDRMGWRTAEER